jgi:hypothetical protein
LLERDADAVVSHQVSGEVEDASWPLEHLEQNRRIGRALPVEVVADMPAGWWRIRDQPVDFGVQRLQVAGGDDVRKNEIALLDEEPGLVVAEQGRGQSTSS